MRIQKPEVLADKAGSGVLISSEIIDTTYGKPEPTGAYASLTMTPETAMRLLVGLQALRDQLGWTSPDEILRPQDRTTGPSES